VFLIPVLPLDSKKLEAETEWLLGLGGVTLHCLSCNIQCPIPDLLVLEGGGTVAVELKPRWQVLEYYGIECEL